MTALIKFEDTVSYRLARVTTAFRSSLERSMGQIGLHGGQVFILFELWHEDGLKQRDLAERLALAAPTVNKMVRGLVQIGLVTNSRLDDDARSTEPCARSRRAIAGKQGEAAIGSVLRVVLFGLLYESIFHNSAKVERTAPALPALTVPLRATAHHRSPKHVCHCTTEPNGDDQRHGVADDDEEHRSHGHL